MLYSFFLFVVPKRYNKIVNIASYIVPIEYFYGKENLFIGFDV
jgi:hypothetical protein